MVHFVFATTKKPTVIWKQLSAAQLDAVTGQEFDMAEECKGYIEGLRSAHLLTGQMFWFTRGLPNEGGIDHDCWTSIDDDQAEFRWMDWFDE